LAWGRGLLPSQLSLVDLFLNLVDIVINFLNILRLVKVVAVFFFLEATTSITFRFY
jgi:hypothetical protein